MVTFSCESCNESIIKKKVGPHINRCRAAVTCIDCSKTFPGQTFKDHNQCITEDQKYQGKLYRQKGGGQKQLEKKESSTKASEKTSDKEVENLAKNAEPIRVKVHKQSPLKKVLKRLRKEHKLDKKQILARLTVDTEGKLLLL